MKTLRNFMFLLLAIAMLAISACKPDDGDDPKDPTRKTVEQLADEWVRVLSNNPGSDGMKLVVTGTQGVLSDKAGSSFKVGDAKWQGLQQADENLSYDFIYEELGSDYNYYASTMTIKEDSAILNVNHTGAGNIQKWVRKGTWTDPGPSGDPIILDCGNISTPTSWKNGASSIDYLVPKGCVIDITDVLEIEAGTVIAFEENAGLGIYDKGALKAVGTATDKIVFKGKESIQGFWRGIHIETNTLNNQLDYVEISDAGSNYVYCCNEAASVLVKGGKLSIKHTEISNGASYGMYVTNGSDLREFEEVRIKGHANYPMAISFEGISQLDGDGSDYTGNDKDYIFVLSTSVNDETSVSPANVPYLLEGKVIDITEKVSVKAGTEFVFQENGGLGVYGNGSLALQGSNAAQVILRGFEPVKGFWRGIHVETSSLDNDINFTTISDAGSNYIYCCNDKASLFLKNGRLSLQNSTIENGAEFGIVAKTNFKFDAYKNNRVTTHNGMPMYLSIAHAGQLDGVGSNYSGNTNDYLLIYNSDLKDPITVQKTNEPFCVELNTVLDIKASLTLEAGVEIAFENEAGLGFYDNGVISAVGNASEKIIFRGLDGTKGSWRGIHLETPNNVMDFVEVRHAGSNYIYCCNDKAGILLKDGDLSLTNSVISQNEGCGVTAKPSATLNESGNTFSDNTDGDICN